MTIRITIKNEDKIQEVRVESSQNLTHVTDVLRFLGPGESGEFYVYDTEAIVVKEA
jgi:hypothetical protein